MKLVIPAFLSHLPVYRGFPIPYFVPKMPDGSFQLKYASPEKMDSCIEHHKCCICFKPLVKGEYYFISGSIGLSTQTDSHPPMHKKCAEYSLSVCPHMYFEKTERTTKETEQRAEWQIRDKPKELFLIHAKRFDAIKPDGKTLVVKYRSVLRAERYAYNNGILEKRPISTMPYI